MCVSFNVHLFCVAGCVPTGMHGCVSEDRIHFWLSIVWWFYVGVYVNVACICSFVYFCQPLLCAYVCVRVSAWTIHCLLIFLPMFFLSVLSGTITNIPTMLYILHCVKYWFICVLILENPNIGPLKQSGLLRVVRDGLFALLSHHLHGEGDLKSKYAALESEEVESPRIPRTGKGTCLCGYVAWRIIVCKWYIKLLEC